MSILWCGSEDIDFPNGGAVTTNLTTTYFRTTYTRCSIASASGHSYSNSFPGGTVTSCWFSFWLGFSSQNSNGSARLGALCAGIGNSSLTNGTGIYVQTASNTGLAIVKFDGTTVTALATGGGGLVTNAIQLTRVDMQVINYGASSTINLYVNGVLYTTFTGNSSVGTLTNFNCVNLWTTAGGNFAANSVGSEFIVADEDTRSMNLKVLPPTGLGTTDNWFGTFTQVNATTITDTNPVYTATPAIDEQFTQGGLPAGTWGVRVVKMSTRGAVPVASPVTHFTPGFNIAGTATVTGGTQHSPGATFQNFEDFWTTNPQTGTGWVATDLATGNLQLDLRSS